MAISSNINQANLQAGAAALGRQQQRSERRAAQQFAADESQRSRVFQERQYNLKTGDKFLEDNPIQSFDEKDRASLGDILAVEYNNAQEEALRARDLITSGDTRKRIEGQALMTKANNAIKKLGEDLMILEQDTEEAANSDLISSGNADIIKQIYKNNVEGTTKVVASTAAQKEGADKNSGRYIQYLDENGEEKFISFDAYRKILNGMVPRQDINTWVEETKKNILPNENYRGTNIEGKRGVVGNHVDSYLSDPKVLTAMQSQLGIEDPAQVKETLIGLIDESLSGTAYRTPRSSGRTPSRKDELLEKELSQRKYDLELATGKTGSQQQAEEFLREKLVGQSTRYGAEEWKGVQMDDVTIDGGNINIQTSKGVRTVPWTADQINSLLNQIRYTSESDAKISVPMAMGQDVTARNFGEGITTDRGDIAVAQVDPQLENVVSSTIDKETGLMKTDAMEGFVANIINEHFRVGLAGIEEEPAGILKWFGKDDKITFLGNDYRVTESVEDVNRLKEDLDKYIKERKGQITVNKKGVGSKY